MVFACQLILIVDSKEEGKFSIKNTDVGKMTGPENFGVEFWYVTDTKKVWKPVLKRANPIKGGNPHGAAYSLNVIPGMETNTVSEYE